MPSPTDKNLVRQITDIVENPDGHSGIKDVDLQFLSAVLAAQKRSNTTNLSGRQRNVISKILESLDA
ncbi:hypothetical protein [Marinobacter sp.]|uniref:hypothetical protein n=1 Tax=Marinobacter sp. TaxID=50741 RepID=UPI00262BBF50|nr:hypothetical protein [Marinobacter sp.]